jgi:hypothetical protein
VQGALIAMVIFSATISRPIEVHLWRARRLSDGTTALLLVSRFPVVAFLFGLILGGSLPRTIVLTLLALLPAAFFYHLVLDVLRDEARSRVRYHDFKG